MEQLRRARCNRITIGIGTYVGSRHSVKGDTDRIMHKVFGFRAAEQSQR